MKRHLAVLIALVGMLVGLLGGTARADVYPLPTTGQGQVDSSSVEAGGCVTFSGSGFKPGTPIVIKDNGRTVDTVNADSNGDFSRPVCFSSDAAVGVHTLTAQGLGANGAARLITVIVTVLGVGSTQPVGGGTGTGGGLPFTGADITFMVLLGLGLLAGGTSLVARGGRRARRRPASA